MVIKAISRELFRSRWSQSNLIGGKTSKLIIQNNGNQLRQDLNFIVRVRPLDD